MRHIFSGIILISSFLYSAAGVAQDLRTLEVISANDGNFVLVDDIIFEVDAAEGLAVQLKDVRLWPDGILPIEFSDDFTAADQAFFFESCELWANVSRVKCIRRTNENAYIEVIDGSSVIDFGEGFEPAKFGNSSELGRKGRRQLFSLTKRDKTNSIIIAHELAHALGFTHQQNSPERDQFVQVNFDNIDTTTHGQGTVTNFEKIRPEKARVFGFYDYCSMMHYSASAFAKTGTTSIQVLGATPSCEYLDSNGNKQSELMGQRKYISDADKMGMAAVYGRDETDQVFVVVPNLIGSNTPTTAMSKELLFNRYGITPVVIAGKIGSVGCYNLTCESTCYWNEVYWQYPSDGTIVELGTATSLKTKVVSKFRSFPPPRGKVCE